jgi:hypothetical protein
MGQSTFTRRADGGQVTNRATNPIIASGESPILSRKLLGFAKQNCVVYVDDLRGIGRVVIK